MRSGGPYIVQLLSFVTLFLCEKQSIYVAQSFKDTSVQEILDSRLDFIVSGHEG